MSLLGELKRRNVFRVGAAYVVLSWLLLQMGDLLFDLMGLPDWGNRIVLVILLLGLPVALIFSYIYELTPEGVKKESEIDRTQSITPETGRKLDYITIGMIVLGVAVVLVDRLVLVQAESPVPAAGSGSVEAGGMEAARSGTDLPQAALSASNAPPPQSEPAANVRQPPESGLSIAVLPFVNMSTDADNEYFADGMAEEILNLIAKAPGLRVISRSSAFSFKGKNLAIPEVAAQLNVNHVLEGSVRRAGDRVRVTAQLIQVADDAHLWSETYDRNLDDIFAVQDEIAGAIAAALQLELGLERHATSSIEAYELVMKGRATVGRRTKEGIEDAAGMFARATELAPDYAEAFGQLAMAHVLQHTWYTRFQGNQKMEAARDVAQRALELDPDNVPALVAAAIHRYYQAEFDESDALFRRALAINPNSVQANNWYGDFLTIVDRSADAVIYETRAVQLDPLLAVHRHNLSAALILDGQIEAGLAEFGKVFELDPEYPLYYQGLAVLAAYGRTAELELHIERLGVGGNYAQFLRLLATGERALALGLLDEVDFPVWSERGSAGYNRAILAGADGDFDRALDYFDSDDLDSYGFAYDFPTDREVLEANPRYARWWRQPPRDQLLKARGHWIWGDEG